MIFVYRLKFVDFLFITVKLAKLELGCFHSSPLIRTSYEGIMVYSYTNYVKII